MPWASIQLPSKRNAKALDARGMDAVSKVPAPPEPTGALLLIELTGAALLLDKKSN